MHLHVHFDDREAVAQAIRGRAHTWTVTTTRDDLIAALPEIEYLFAPVPPRGIWGAASRLRLVQLGGVGADLLLPAPDLPARVHIGCARGLFADEAAEYAIAAMLAVWRGIPRLVARQRAHEWICEPAARVAGRTLAVLGYGEIGRRIADIGTALRMRVIAARRRPDRDGSPIEIVSPERIPEIVALADCVIVALPLTPATRGLLSRALLETLRPGAVVVVISRGGIVDTQALADLTARERIRGAALDVFEREPLPADDPLWDHERLLLSPHNAGYGEEYLARTLDRFVANAERIARGDDPLDVVDREAGY